MSMELNKESVEQAGANVGHGHVFPRADGVKMRCGGPGLCSECTADASHARAVLAQPSPAQAEQATADDYEEVLADHRRLVRELDVLLNGEACAAKQAMLCDLVSQVEAEVRKSGQPLLVSAERYRWLRNDDNWGADDSEGQGTSKWANLGELSGTDFDAYLDQLRGSNPVMDIDPEHSKAIAKRGRDAIVAQAEGAPVIGCLCGMPMTEGRHSPGGCTSLEEFAPNPAQAQSEQAEAERPEVVAYRTIGRHTKHQHPHYALNYYKQNAEDQAAHWRERGCEVSEDELMTVAQHERIVGALRAENAKLSEALDRWPLIRDSLKLRLADALARVAELEGKLTDWVHEGFRLNEALAVAKAQHSVPDDDMILQIFADNAEHSEQGDEHGYCIVREQHAQAIARKLLAAAPGKEGA
ncbi:hypothetical protein ISH39_03235 [Pseudomonas aeruginosa]|nr:hypothetical protein [Pseudomonas aeruginosa]